MISVDLPYPHKCLWPNGRAHWRAVAAQKKLHRQWAKLMTQDALPAGWKWAGEALTITIRVFPKPTGPAPDCDNVVASAKAFLDGIADALLVDDQYFLAPVVEFEADRAGRFVIEVSQ